MREVSVAALGRPTEGRTLAACLATILEDGVMHVGDEVRSSVE
jgi:hypothetical protein